MFGFLNLQGILYIFLNYSLSRGRGIVLLNNLVEILDHVKIKDSCWVVQKYIEKTHNNCPSLFFDLFKIPKPIKRVFLNIFCVDVQYSRSREKKILYT